MCFDGQATAADDYSNGAHLAQMFSILGPFATALVQRSERGSEFFDDIGSFCPKSCSSAFLG